MVGAGCHINRIGQCPREGVKALAIFSGFGEAVERLFGALDQVFRAFVHGRVESLVDDVRADADKLPSLGQLINHAAIFFGVDDCSSGGCKSSEIGRPTDFLHRGIGLKIGLQRDGRGELANTDQRGGGFKNARVNGFREMIG